MIQFRVSNAGSAELIVMYKVSEDQGSKLPNLVSGAMGAKVTKLGIRAILCTGHPKYLPSCPPIVHLEGCFVRTPERGEFRDRSARRNFGGKLPK